MRGKRSIVKFWRKIIIAVLALNLVLPSWAGAYQEISKKTGEEILTRGAVLQTVAIQTSEGPLNVYVLKIDLTDPYLKVDTVIGADGTLNKNQPVLEMARRTGAVAAINGDYFQMKESGRPIGLVYQDGRLIESPALRNDMYGFGLTVDKTALLEIFEFSGQVTAENQKSFPLSGINKPGYLFMSGISSDSETLNLYDPMWGATSRGKLPDLTGVVEAVVSKGVVQQVLVDQPGVPIPKDGFILKGHGQAAAYILENLPVGSTVSYTYSVRPRGEELLAAVGGQALLVEDGQLPAYFTQNIPGNNARTAVGISRDENTLYLVAVEKQSASDGSLLSRGMTQEELAGFLISLGVWRAVNLDGGGSTTLAARHLGDTEASLINLPQGLAQRAVPNAIGLFSTAPKGELKGLNISGPAVILTGTKGKFAAKGYDEYYNPFRIGPAQVEWTVSPAPAGVFEGNIFIPGAGGSATITAEYGNVSSKSTIRVIGPESLSSLSIAPASLELEPGQSATLSVKVSTHFGEIFDLEPTDLKWSLDNRELGQIVDGKFTAANKFGSGFIQASFQGLTASVPVQVQPPSFKLQAVPEENSEINIENRIQVLFPAWSVAKPVEFRLMEAEMPAELPSDCLSAGAVRVEPAEEEEITSTQVPWQLNWQYNADTIAGRPAIWLWDTEAAQWREQPSGTETGEQGDGSISARLWEFGTIVLVDDQRPGPSFSDTGKHWANEDIRSLAARGVAKGFPDGSFGPDQGVTRAQFVSFLAAALQWPAPESDPAFKDGIPAWAGPAVSAAFSRGVITGYPDGTFAPEARITRGEMAVMISRALGLEDTVEQEKKEEQEAMEGSKDPKNSQEQVEYKDSSTIPGFARDAVARVSAAGLFKGSGGLFRPLDGATRAETATVVSRVINWWVK